MLTAVKPIAANASRRDGVPWVGRTSMARSPVAGRRATTSASSSGNSVGVPPPT